MIRKMTYIFIPSGCSKLVPPKMLKNMWPTLPDWFWPACGVFELTIPVILNFYQEKTDLAMIMVCDMYYALFECFLHSMYL